MILVEPVYWDLRKKKRPLLPAWSRRFFANFGQDPTLSSAGAYSAVCNISMAFKAVKTDGRRRIEAGLKSFRSRDMFARNGKIRADGRMLHASTGSCQGAWRVQGTSGTI